MKIKPRQPEPAALEAFQWQPDPEFATYKGGDWTIKRTGYDKFHVLYRENCNPVLLIVDEDGGTEEYDIDPGEWIVYNGKTIEVVSDEEFKRKYQVV